MTAVGAGSQFGASPGLGQMHKGVRIWASAVPSVVVREKSCYQLKSSSSASDSLMMSGTSQAKKMVDFSGNPVLLPEPGKRAESQESEIHDRT